MKLSLNWLKEFLFVRNSVAEIVEALTFAGVEVEGVEQRGAELDKVIVAQIDEFEPHPNADRLTNKSTPRSLPSRNSGLLLQRGPR
jgi:phenylalanyl-tRNA synthetase beta chain